MKKTNNTLLVPSSYSRIIARELGLQERELPQLIRETGLASTIFMAGDKSHINAIQQMQILENAMRISDDPEFGLRLGRRLQPASHGPIGYLVLSSPDVQSALEAFATYLPLRLPFSEVNITSDQEWLVCTLSLKITPSTEVKRVLHECFALMLQAIVETVLGQHLEGAHITLDHPEPSYYSRYSNYFHVPVEVSQAENTFKIPIDLAHISNISGHSDTYTIAQELCLKLLEKMPSANLSVSDQVRRLLLSSPMGSLLMNNVANAMYITRRTLTRRLEKEGTSYREITERLGAELAARHLLDSDMTVESVATLLGYYDTAAFRKAFHRWYGKSPSEYCSTQREQFELHRILIFPR
jgi:AraC-like DNA-binding protein